MAWPTQPVPVLPEPFARQTVTAGDISPYAENREALAAELAQARVGAFQPFGTDETILLPGFDGGGEWGGAAADPDGILYVNACEMAYIQTG
jgi:quinoprotein glucose dehydrogenase